MRIAAFALVFLMVLYLVDRCLLWLESKGKLYYRDCKPQNVTGNALMELHTFLNPSVKYVVETKHDLEIIQKQDVSTDFENTASLGEEKKDI